MLTRAFNVLRVAAYIADMGEGKGDDLTIIRRVGQHFLIAAHGGIEAYFAKYGGGGADALPFKYRSVREQ